jgi:tetrahydromethanopterin S-methyltransferase subunit B
VKVGANPKSYATRVAGVDCAVWGEDLAKTEQMVNDLIVALHRECMSRGNYELRGAEWVTAGELTNNGIVYLLRLAIDIPIVGPPAIPVRPQTETSHFRVNP